MENLGILNGFSQWKQSRYEKVVTDMESLGKCPDCRGKGFTSSYSSVYIPNFDAFFDCPGCNGTGNFTDWNLNQQQFH